MLPCLNKQLFGIDCLGCGIQRAFINVIKGNFIAAFNLYPAIYTLLIMAIFLLLNFKYQFKNSKKIIITFATINVLIIVVSYFIKMKFIFNL
ncbi:DUF2752 domain-containing protein [Polaribacter sargassicola]|uniref:DUF2752 domain-containing protein n=1 Tax=Polaribacter sargassicola TaxID=2836891 RepID=UPI001F1D6205|nr:DUF2752 domain-containing protein [Polaribacter sp. DS7-9]MCG1036441.1 DUF2752 domain-containing protein [Polaribacter sp. DS7-9]